MDKSKTTGIHTDYTNRHLRKADLSAADFVFRVGVVVLDANGDLLVFEDDETGILQLPRSRPLPTFDDLNEPLRFVSEQTGLKIDPLPLPAQSRRYRRPQLEWNQLEQDLVLDGAATTTDPFSVALDVNWKSVPESKLLDAQQVVVAWYSGVVRHSIQPDSCSLRGAQFIAINEFSNIMLGQTPYDAVGSNALNLFRVLWSETKRREEKKPHRT
ncbi:hypothetical protein EXIGLDRAFT_706200 [Exidia glandulosa HHB12029]|uniref:Uncharacterized protein n=1 Tax=Exidia glandulosa HHB12029 TaxID=1314781 RepID=A0A165B5S3_EXIGL|nr:hypothetical protein EXIGLDRAFT_706200 [Exidia glandulosa HHB12029]